MTAAVDPAGGSDANAEATARSRIGAIAGKILLAGIGIGLTAYVVWSAGPAAVAGAVKRALPFLPLVAALEVAKLSGDLAALAVLYRPAKVPLGALARAGLASYAIGSVLPAGRVVAEAVRGAMLATYADGPTAAAAGTKLQGLALVANGIVTFACLACSLLIAAPHIVSLLMLVNAVGVLVMGIAILQVGKRSGLGGFLGKRLTRIGQAGPRFDELLKEPTPNAALGYATLGRAAQVVQYGVVLAALGIATGPVRAFYVEGLQLVGAMIGDVLPGALGATEGNFAFAASTIGLQPNDSVAIPLVVRAAQLVLIGVGFLVPLLWPAPRVVATKEAT